MLPALNQSIVNESEHMYVYFQVGCRVVTQGPYWSVECRLPGHAGHCDGGSRLANHDCEVGGGVVQQSRQAEEGGHLDHLQTVSSSPTRTRKTSVQIPLLLNFLVGDAFSGFHL